MLAARDMDRLLARLERRLGRFAIPNLMYYIVGGMAIVWVLGMARPGFIDALRLDLDAIRHGQVWRLVTFMFIPPETSPIFIILMLYWTWMIGANLEGEWGAFKLNLYYLLGALFTIVVAAFAGPSGNTWLNLSMYLAFATLFPDFQIYVMWVIPIRVKWVGMLIGAGLIVGFALGDWSARGAILAGVANYLIFFTGHFVDLLKRRNLVVRQTARRTSLSPPPAVERAAKSARVCAICGKSEADDADIRVCTCEKCGGKPRNLCLEHARNH